MANTHLLCQRTGEVSSISEQRLLGQSPGNKCKQLSRTILPGWRGGGVILFADTSSLSVLYALCTAHAGSPATSLRSRRLGRQSLWSRKISQRLRAVTGSHTQLWPNGESVGPDMCRGWLAS